MEIAENVYFGSGLALHLDDPRLAVQSLRPFLRPVDAQPGFAQRRAGELDGAARRLFPGPHRPECEFRVCGLALAVRVARLDPVSERLGLEWCESRQADHGADDDLPHCVCLADSFWSVNSRINCSS